MSKRKQNVSVSPWFVAGLERPQGRVEKALVYTEGGKSQKFYIAKNGNFIRELFSYAGKVYKRWYKQNGNFTNKTGEIVTTPIGE